MDPLAQASLWAMVVLSGIVGGLVDLRSATQGRPRRRRRTKGQFLGAAMVAIGSLAAFVGFGLLFTALTEDTPWTERNPFPGAVMFISALATTFLGVGASAWSSARASAADRGRPDVADRPRAQPTATHVEAPLGDRKVA